MFVDIYTKRMLKWEKIVTNTLLKKFEDAGWENVYFDEITDEDIGKYIQIINVQRIYTMARSMINGFKYNTTIFENTILTKKRPYTVTIVNIDTNKTLRINQRNKGDLLFLKEVPPEESHKKPKIEIEKNKSTQDPLRAWCDSFLTQYAETNCVDKSMDSIPSYKPTQTQIQKLQKKRKEEMLQWGTNF